MNIPQYIGSEFEDYAVGDIGFLISQSNEGQTTVWHLSSHPPHTNESHEPRLYGWCGSYNNISTHGNGMAEVTKICANGRARIRALSGDKLIDALESLGYPELSDQIAA